MTNTKYDLAIAYRVYPNVSKRGPPPIFGDNKYNLVEFCLKSFIKSIGQLKVKLWVILDNCPHEYELLFRKYFNKEDLIILNKNQIGNLATFGLQVKILSEQVDTDIVYFAEDDYYYFPAQFEKMISLLKNKPKADFVTPYEHPNYYTDQLHKHKTLNLFYQGKKWKTCSTTCLTFLTTKRALKKSQNIFMLYTDGKLKDRSVWLSLTKFWVFHPFKLVKYYFKNYSLFQDISTALKYGWKNIFLGKRWKLWYPIPTIATHMVKKLLSPNIDWQSVFSEELHNINE